jgi:hypothetical protein
MGKILFLFLLAVPLYSGAGEVPVRGFSITLETTLPGQPVEIYDAISGDISGWWDHSFSGKPYRFYVEAKPGGGFYEIINEQGDGYLHATVIAAERGKLLRFDGPLGLSGMAVQVVTSYRFDAVGNDSTRLGVDVNGQGAIPENVPAIVENVWKHFIFEQFQPYIENGHHREKK